MSEIHVAAILDITICPFVGEIGGKYGKALREGGVLDLLTPLLPDGWRIESVEEPMGAIKFRPEHAPTQEEIDQVRNIIRDLCVE